MNQRRTLAVITVFVVIILVCVTGFILLNTGRSQEANWHAEVGHMQQTSENTWEWVIDQPAYRE